MVRLSTYQTYVHFTDDECPEFGFALHYMTGLGCPHVVLHLGKENAPVVCAFLKPEHIDQIEAAIARYREQTAAQPAAEAADQATDTQKG